MNKSKYYGRNIKCINNMKNLGDSLYMFIDIINSCNNRCIDRYVY